MRIAGFVVPAVVLMSAADAQFVERSFPAPGDDITALATGGNSVYAMDPVDGMIYQVNDWTGAPQDTIALPFTYNTPVGLGFGGAAESRFWFAEAGTAIVHEMDTGGTIIATHDFSDSGVQSITGLDIGFLEYNPYAVGLFFIDSATRIVYEVPLPVGSAPLEVYLDIEGCPEVYDIGPPRSMDAIPVACADPVSPVRCYYDADSYETLGYGEYESARGVGPATEWNRFYFSDPVTGMIDRYCLDMGGIEDDGLGGICSSCVFPNPAAGPAIVRFVLDTAAAVDVSVFDVSGRLVQEAPAIPAAAGVNDTVIGGFAPGVYLVRVSTQAGVSVHRLVELE